MNQIDERLRTNPFSSTALAAIELTGRPPVTVVTSAIETGTEVLNDYLRLAYAERTNDLPDSIAQLERSPSGRLLVVVGDYGMGKTHLANHLLREAVRQSGDGDRKARPRTVVHVAYLTATAGGFDQLYRDFVTVVDPVEVARTVDDYYADVVAGTLAKSDYTKDIALQIRTGEREAAEVVEDLDLIDTLLARELREVLTKIAKRAGLGTDARADEFGNALALLLLRRNQFGDEVWEWLEGKAPSETLVRRGVHHQIRGDAMALEGLGVLAYLFGRSQHRMVVAIDELSQMLFASHAARSPMTDWFRRLLETFDAAGAFLITAALPDLFEKLGGSAGARPGTWLELSPFDRVAIQSLIERTQTWGAMEPFTPDCPALLERITGGSPRQVIRLCHRAWQLKIQDGLGAISAEVIMRAARVRTDFPTRTVVRVAVREALQGLAGSLRVSFREQYWHPEVFESVDFWVTADSQEASCAIILTDSVVTEEDALALTTKAHKFHPQNVDGSKTTAAPSIPTVLVVIGHLHLGFREKVIRAFESEPIHYGVHDFKEELGATVTSALGRVERLRPDDVLERVRSDLGRLTVQQAHSQDYLDRLALRIDELNAAVTHLPAAMSRDLRAPTFVQRLGVTASAEAAIDLPRPVVELFQSVLHLLTELADTRPAFRYALDPAASSDDLAHRRQRLWPWLDSKEFYQAVGVLTILREVVVAFQDSVTEFWARHGQAASSPDDATRATAALREVCESYEMVVDHLRLPDLDERPVTLGRVGREDREDREDIARSVWRDRWRVAKGQVKTLGQAVLSTAYPLLGGENH